MKLWIDTDAGVDDSTAILIALSAPDVEIVGISCVGGNAHLENVIRNVNRTLNVWGSGGKIPIYAGCDCALIQPLMVIPEIHGKDGLGDIDDKDFGIEGMPIHTEKEHAVNALIAAAEKYKDELTLMTLGPLTTVAIAFRMNRAAMCGIKEVIVMGGAEDGVGNTNPYAEFNIRCDPEAAEIVFKTFPQNRTIMASWTLTQKYNVTGENFEVIGNKGDTTMGRWVRDTWKAITTFTGGNMLMADPLASFICCHREKAVVEAQRLKIDIVLHGEKIGMTEATPDENGVLVVTAIDFEFYKQTLLTMMNNH